MKKGLSISIQAVLFFISMTLFIIYYFKLFRFDSYNKLSLIFSLVMFIWFLSIVIRYCFPKIKVSEGEPIINVPYDVKCFVGDVNCASGDINEWSIIHFFLYLFIGLYIPNLYIEVLFISIICELIETSISHTSKYIIDPLTNLFGYLVGSYISKYRYVNIIKSNFEYMRVI